MNRRITATFALSMMITIAYVCLAVMPVVAQQALPDQIHDHQELAEYHGGTLHNSAPSAVVGSHTFQQITTRAELADYQAFMAGQPAVLDTPLSAVQRRPFDQIADRAELAEYQAAIASQPTVDGKESNAMAAQ
ncbi:MAG: hypothetical protein KDE58_39260 [Caldilineaceae bacterium]|nr:hypothetical protein [Caldilineaceae bacterium]